MLSGFLLERAYDLRHLTADIPDSDALQYIPRFVYARFLNEPARALRHEEEE